jgi:hypothetical protein
VSAPLPKLNVLIAYPYFTDDMRAILHAQDPASFRLIVDSGAFTAWNTGQDITMEGYTGFLRSLPAHWEQRAVQLDVYGNPQATYDNWRTMLDTGFRDVMPVFTRGETLERLDEFYSVVDYIMFGGIAFGGENKNYIKWFCEQNKGRKAHWLGFVNIPFLQAYKPESVDSSSQTGAERYGTMAYYAGGGKLATLHMTDFQQRPPQPFVDACVRLGFTLPELKRLANRDAWRGAVKTPNAESLWGFAAFVSYCHHVYRAVQVERNLGTKVYLAFASPFGLRAVFAARHHLQQRGVL